MEIGESVTGNCDGIGCGAAVDAPWNGGSKDCSIGGFVRYWADENPCYIHFKLLVYPFVLSFICEITATVHHTGRTSPVDDSSDGYWLILAIVWEVQPMVNTWEQRFRIQLILNAIFHPTKAIQTCDEYGCEACWYRAGVGGGNEIGRGWAFQKVMDVNLLPRGEDESKKQRGSTYMNRWVCVHICFKFEHVRLMMVEVRSRSGSVRVFFCWLVRVASMRLLSN